MTEDAQAGNGSRSDGSQSDQIGQAARPRRPGPSIHARPLVVLVIGVIAVAVGWRIIWEQKHPAAAPARKVQQGDASARITAIHELEALGRSDPEVAIPALVRGLDDADPTVRAAAASALVLATNVGSGAESARDQVRIAVDALMRSLKDERAEVRAAVAQSLWMIAISQAGPAGSFNRSQVFDRLVEATGDPDAGVRLAALRGVGAVGLGVVDVPPSVLVAAMDDELEPNRAAAVFALMHFRRGLHRLVPTLLRSLESARPESRARYLEVLSAIRSPQFSAEAEPALVTMLASADAEARALAATALATYKETPPEAIPALIHCLADSRGTKPAGPGAPQPTRQELMAEAVESLGPFSTRRVTPSTDAVVGAARTLGQFAPPTEQAGDAIAALANVLRSGSAPQRVAAARALGQFPTGHFLHPEQGQVRNVHADPIQIAALTAALGDADSPVRVAALSAFHDVGMRTRFAASPELNAAIARALEDPIAESRTQAAAAIAHYADVADRFFPALIRHAEHDPNEEVRSMCCSVITLGSQPLPARVTPAIIPVLTEALSSPEGRLRRSVCQLLLKFGASARPAIPALIRALQVPVQNPGFLDDRAAAVEALGQLALGTPQAAEVIAALGKVLRPEDTEITYAVASALGRFGTSSTPAVPEMVRTLREAAQQKRPRSAAWIAAALSRIDPSAPVAAEAVPALREALRSQHSIASQSHIADALSRFGPAAADAVPELVALLKRSGRRGNGFPADRARAARALAQIAPGTPQADLAVSGLMETLQDVQKWPKDEGGAEAIEALARFGPGAASATPQLSELARTADPQLREAAQKALSAIEAKRPDQR
jgi:HEAT repeat protein